MTRGAARAGVSFLAILGAASCRAADAERSARARGRVERLLEVSSREPLAYEYLTSLVREAPRRLSGSDGADRAVEWGMAAFRGAGVPVVREEPVRVPVWVRGPVEEAAVEVMGLTNSREPLSIATIGGSPATPPEGIVAEVVEVHHWDDLDRRRSEIASRIVFYNRPMDRDPATFQAYGRAVDQRARGAFEATRRGAVAALVRSATTRLDDHPHTGSGKAFLEDGTTPVVPSAALSTVAADRLHALLEEHGSAVRVHLRLSSRFEADRWSANVVAEIPGSEWPEEVVLLGAHLDAWDLGEGAHDDGAGCAHVVEALRLLLRAGARPKRTIRGVLFMNEENGLAGARAYAERHGGESHRAAFESDSGGFLPEAVFFRAEDPQFDSVKRVAEALRPAVRVEARPGGGGADLSPLEARGVPAGQLLTHPERYFDLHHTAKDRLSEVDAAELQLGAVVLAALAWEFADP